MTTVRIYGINKAGELVSVEAHQTAKLYQLVHRVSWLNYDKQINIDSPRAHLTPEAAIEARINVLRQVMHGLRKTMSDTEAMLTKVEALQIE